MEGPACGAFVFSEYLSGCRRYKCPQSYHHYQCMGLLAGFFLVGTCWGNCDCANSSSLM